MKIFVTGVQSRKNWTQTITMRAINKGTQTNQGERELSDLKRNFFGDVSITARIPGETLNIFVWYLTANSQ